MKAKAIAWSRVSISFPDGEKESVVIGDVQEDKPNLFKTLDEYKNIFPEAKIDYEVIEKA